MMSNLRQLSVEFRKRRPDVVLAAQIGSANGSSKKTSSDDQQKGNAAMDFNTYDQDDEYDDDFDQGSDLSGPEGEGSLLGLSMGIVDRFLHHKQAAFSEAARHRYYSSAQNQSDSASTHAEPTISIGLSAGESELYDTAMSLVQQYLKLQGDAKLEQLKKSLSEEHRVEAEISIDVPHDTQIVKVDNPIDFLRMLVAAREAAAAPVEKKKSTRKKRTPPAASSDTPTAE